MEELKVQESVVDIKKKLKEIEVATFFQATFKVLLEYQCPFAWETAENKTILYFSEKEGYGKVLQEIFQKLNEGKLELLKEKSNF